jgi:hypothetical protein
MISCDSVKNRYIKKQLSHRKSVVFIFQTTENIY